MASLAIDLPPCTHRYLPLSSCRGASYSRNDGGYLIVVYLFVLLNSCSKYLVATVYILKKTAELLNYQLKKRVRQRKFGRAAGGTSSEEESAAQERTLRGNYPNYQLLLW